MNPQIETIKNVIASVAKQSQRVISTILILTFTATSMPTFGKSASLLEEECEASPQGDSPPCIANDLVWGQSLLAPQSRFAKNTDAEEIETLMEKLRREVSDNTCEAAFKLAMKLAGRYATLRDEASKALLSKFLSDLADVLRFRVKYCTAVDPAYYAIEYKRFQKLHGFVEDTIYPVLVKKFQNDESALAMFEPIEVLLEELDGSHHRARDPIDRDVNLVKQCEEVVHDKSRIKFLLKQYSMSGVKIEIGNSGWFSKYKGVVRLHKKSNNHFIIDLSGVPDSHREYVLLHEFLHIWLDRRGLTFDYESEDEDVGLYLWLLRDLVLDYIVEKEIYSVSGNAYGYAMSDRRDYYLTNHVPGDGETSGILLFMLALTGKLTTSFYPNLKDSKSQHIISPEGIQLGNMDEVIAVLDKVSIQSRPEEFREAVLDMHHLLTGGACIFTGSSIDLLDETDIKRFIETINASTESMLQAVRSEIRRKSEEIEKRRNARGGA